MRKWFKDLLSFFFTEALENLLVLIEFVVYQFVLLPHLDPQEHQFDAVDIAVKYLSPSKSPG